MPALVLMAISLSACGQRESGYHPYTSFERGVEKKTGTEPVPQTKADPASPHEGSGLTREKSLPKLVPVKTFSERSTEKLEFYRSTAAAPSGISGSTVIINVNAAPNVLTAPAPVKAPDAVPAIK